MVHLLKQRLRGWRDDLVVRALTAIGQNLSPVPSTHARLFTITHNSVFKGADPFLDLVGTYTHRSTNPHTDPHNIYNLKINGTMFSISLFMSMLNFHSSQICNTLITSERNPNLLVITLHQVTPPAKHQLDFKVWSIIWIGATHVGTYAFGI